MHEGKIDMGLVGTHYGDKLSYLFRGQRQWGRRHGLLNHGPKVIGQLIIVLGGRRGWGERQNHEPRRVAINSTGI